MITCGSDSYKVHKAIVCSQSEFFRLACRNHHNAEGDFKEAKTGIVEIPCRNINTSATEPEDFKWNPDAEDPKCVKNMIHYLYRLDYLEVETAKITTMDIDDEVFDKTYALAEGILIEHAKMYAMADKYGIPGLKDLALKKYEKAHEHTSAGFANSMIVAFTSTVDSDKDLRQVIIDILHGDLVNLMEKEEINLNVKELPLLSHALLRKRLDLSP